MVQTQWSFTPFFHRTSYSPLYPTTSDAHHSSLTTSNLGNLYCLPPHFPCVEKVMKIVIMWCTKLLVDIIPMASDSKNLSASCCILHRWQTQPFSRLLRLLCLFPFLNWEKIKTHQLYSSRLYNSRAFSLYPFLTTGSFSIFSHHPGLAPMSAKEMASCSRIQTLQIKEDSMASMKYVFWRR